MTTTTSTTGLSTIGQISMNARDIPRAVKFYRYSLGMRLLFEGWGCKVLTHSGWKSIQDAGAIFAPDIILADYHLDGETGLDLIARLRGRFGDAIPAVLVTADRSNEAREAADLMDVSVINKPLKPAVLRSLMTRLRRMTPAAAE